MRLTDAVQPVLIDAAMHLHGAAAGFLAESLVLERTNLDGDDWADRYDEALRTTGPGWRPSDSVVRDVRAALALLGEDPRAVAARAQVVAALGTMTSGYNYIGDVLRNLPAELTPRFAGMALGRIGQAGRVISGAIEQAALGIDALASGQPSAVSHALT